MEQQFLIQGGRCLLQADEGNADWRDTDIALAGLQIAAIGDDMHVPGLAFDASGLLVLPAMIDIHGDAFERQIQPRPATTFSHAIALADTDRQLIANGIATAFHGVTYSWEGGLRGRDAALALMTQLEQQRSTASADHRIHLRFENHHLDGVQDALDWIASGRVDFFAFNEHLPSMLEKLSRPEKLSTLAERARCDIEVFKARMAAAKARSAEVPAIVTQLAAACRARGIPMASHDDTTSTDREYYQGLDVQVSEFPRSQEALLAAQAMGNHTVMGAPNVLLGGSHCGSIATLDAVRKGMCDILASDYYYPSLLQAPFILAEAGACSLADAWKLVSCNPAAVLGMNDRGRLAVAHRADLILVEQLPAGAARLIATFAAGKLVYCAEPGRLHARIAQSNPPMMALAA